MSNSNSGAKLFVRWGLVLAAALTLASCGNDPSEPSTGLETVDVALTNGSFATKELPKVPDDALIVLKFSADGQGPYRVGVLSSKTAQTFKIPENSTKTVSLDALGPGGEAKLILNNKKQITLTTIGR